MPTRPPPTDRSSRPRVVAILPLYQGAAWVDGALRSILAQTVPADEIIVVDDGSTDDGPAIARALLEGLPHARVVTQLNAGQSAARNLAISLTTCAWVALIDQDDFWYPTHLEDLLEVVENHRGLRLGWVYSDFDDIDLDGRMVARDFIERTRTDNPKRDLVKVLQQGFAIQPSATLISRDAIVAVGGFDERLSGYEDDDLFLRIFQANYDNVYLPHPTSQWRIHASSSGGSDRMEESLRYYSGKLLAAFEDDRWRGFYYGRDIIAPRMINTWLQMYVRASRYKNRSKMKLYAEEARRLVPHLRPRARMTMWAVLVLLRNPLIVRFRTATEENQSMALAPLVAYVRRWTRI